MIKGQGIYSVRSRIIELSAYITIMTLACYYFADKNELLLSFICCILFLVTVFVSSRYGREIERKEILEELILLHKENPKELSPDILNIIIERLVFKDKSVDEILEISKKLYKDIPQNPSERRG